MMSFLCMFIAPVFVHGFERYRPSMGFHKHVRQDDNWASIKWRPFGKQEKWAIHVVLKCGSAKCSSLEG